MKTRYLLMVMLLLLFSCGKITVSDSEKEKIQKEVKERINTTVKAIESADADALKQSIYDTPNYRYSSGGKITTTKRPMNLSSGFFQH